MERLDTKSVEKKPLTAQEKRDQNQRELQQKLESVQVSPERPAQKLQQLNQLYRSQLQFELHDERFETREQLQNLSEQMLQNLVQQKADLEALQKKEPSQDITNSLENLNRRIEQMQKANETSTSMSIKQERIARRLLVYQSESMAQIRKAMVPLMLAEIKLRLQENPPEHPFEVAFQQMKETIQELDLTDDAIFIGEAYTSVYSDQMLKLEYENLQKLREEKEEATEAQRLQAFDLFTKVKYADLTRLNVRSALTKAEDAQLNFEKDDDQQRALRKKLAENFSEQSFQIYKDFLHEQEMDHLLPKDRNEYHEFCSRNGRVLSTVLFQDRMALNPSEVHQQLLDKTDKMVEEARLQAREMALKGQTDQAKELRNEADLIEDFHNEYEKNLRIQSLPPQGVTFGAASWVIDKLPSIRDLRYDHVLVWGPAAFVGLSTMATNMFPLGKDIFMQFYTKLWEPLTLNPFAWPKMIKKLVVGGASIPFGIVGDSIKWASSAHSAFSSVLGLGIVTLAASKRGREMVSNAFEIAAKEVTGTGPVASLIEGINDLAKGGLEKMSKSEYIAAMKNFIYSWLWRQPADFLTTQYDNVRNILDGFDIKIDEIKEHQASVVSTRDRLAQEYDSAKSITVRYEKYNSFLLNLFDEKADPENYKIPVELMRDIGFFGRNDTIGPEQELDLKSGNTFDVPYAIAQAAESTASLETANFLTSGSILPKQVLNVSSSDQGIWYVTPNMLQDALGTVGDNLVDDVRHPMRYLTKEQLGTSIMNNRTELITQVGQQTVKNGEFKGSLDKYLVDNLRPKLSEEDLLKELSSKAGFISQIDQVSKDLDALYPPTDLSGEKKEEALVNRKLYLVKMNLLSQSFNAALNSHTAKPPQTRVLRSTSEFTPGPELFQTWKKQKEWLQKTQSEYFFSRSKPIVK